MVSLEVPFLLSHVSTAHLLYLHTLGLSFLSPSLRCHLDHLHTLGISFHTLVLHPAFLFLCLSLVQFNIHSSLPSVLTLSLPIMDLALSNLAREFSSILALFSNGSNPTPLSFISRSCVQFTFDHTWADSTLTKYHAIVTLFHTFCDSEQIPPRFCLPASGDLLCTFAASRMCSISGSRVKSHIATLKVWHIYNNVPWFGGARLHYILHGVENLTPARSRRPPWPPITRTMIVILASHLSSSDPFDVCCLAAASCAMWAQLCMGEILSQWETSFTPSKTVCRLHLKPPFNSNGSHICHLPFTMVAKSKGEDICICCQNDASDPISALDCHLHINNPPQNFPLFSHLSLRGWHCLSKKKLLAHCNSI